MTAPQRPPLPDYPFTPRHWIRPDGLAMHYVDEGSGPPVVMVHGNPTWSFFFRRLITGLAGKFRALAPDHLGMGFSARPAAAEYGFRLRDRAGDFQGWLDSLRLDEPVHLIVHDWGGPVALAWAGEHPDRVASVTLLNTALRRPPGYRLPLRLALFKLAAPAGDFLARRRNVFARGTAFFGPTRRPLSPQARAGFLAPYARAADRLALARFIEDIPLNPDHPSFDDLRRADRRFDEALAGKPLAIIWGWRDFVFNRRIFFDWLERRPDAETLVLPEAGHYLLEDEPERILSCVQKFLNQLVSGENPA